MNKPLVTVAIPTFNRAASFLPGCLAAARAQTYPNLEILVSDNASTDGTEAVVRGLAGDQRIRYVRQAVNMGSPRNMNFCIQECRGDYVVVLPDDDGIDPDFVECCMREVAATPGVGLIRTGCRVIDKDSKVVREVPNRARNGAFSTFLEDWIAGVVAPYQCSTLFRADALKQVGLHSRHYLFDDVVAHFKVAATHGARNVFEPKASFRLHPGELTESTPIREWCEESRDLLQLMIELCPEQREFLESRGLEFLAIANYRRAWRRSWLQRPKAILTILLTHRLTVPSRRVWLPALRRRVQRLVPAPRSGQPR